MATGEGWFVLGARDGRWRIWDGLGARLSFEGDTAFPQVGINLFVLAPGEPMGMYHWEADQEDFLVLSGEALLIVEGEERPLRQWDFVHCPALTKHTIVGAGSGPSAVLAVGAANTTAARTGAGTPLTRSRFVTAPAPIGRRMTPTLPTVTCRRERSRAIARAGSVQACERLHRDVVRLRRGPDVVVPAPSALGQELGQHRSKSVDLQSVADAFEDAELGVR